MRLVPRRRHLGGEPEHGAKGKEDGAEGADRRPDGEPPEHPPADRDVDGGQDREDRLVVGCEAPDGHERQQDDGRERRKRQEAARHAIGGQDREHVLEVRVARNADDAFDRVADRDLALEVRRGLPDEVVVVAVDPGRASRWPGPRWPDQDRPRPPASGSRPGPARGVGPRGSARPPCATLRSTFPRSCMELRFPVIGPAFGGTVRGSGTPSRATGTRDTVGAVLAVLALGLALRLIIAYLLPGSGFGPDLSAFDFWMRNLAAEGPFGFYQRDFFHDYTPGYLYALWFVGWLATDAPPGEPRRHDPDVPGLRDQGGADPRRPRHRLARPLDDPRARWSSSSCPARAPLLAVLNPISWFDSVVWGQADSVGVVFLLLGLRELWRDRPERAALWTVVAAIVKPQLGILIPLVAVVTIRRALWPDGGEGDPSRTGRPIRILTTGLAGFLTAVALVPAVRALRDRAHQPAPVHPLGPARAGGGRGRRLPVPHRQCLQPVGALPVGPGQSAWRTRVLGLRLRRGGHLERAGRRLLRPNRRRHHRGRSRPS